MLLQEKSQVPHGCEGSISHAKRLCNLQAWSRFCFDWTSPEPICTAVLQQEVGQRCLLRFPPASVLHCMEGKLIARWESQNHRIF